MANRLTRRERCRIGKHTPSQPMTVANAAVRHDTCRYCGQPIMRTQATRIWFLAGMLAERAEPFASRDVSTGSS